MSARPRVIETGHTVRVLHPVYRIQYPDGRWETYIPGLVDIQQCRERAMERARRRWARLRRQRDER
jgi:hypothetical protein